MKLRLIKDTCMKGAPNVKLLSGSTVEVPAEVGAEWLRAGVAVPELPAAEKAIIPPAETRETGTARKPAKTKK